MKIIFAISLTALLFSCAAIRSARNAYSTVAEVEAWSEHNRDFSTWKGLLLYQGSDSLSHRFVSRIMDEWIWFKVRRTELDLDEIHPYGHSSKSHFGYYYVDPKRQFLKIQEFPGK